MIEVPTIDIRYIGHFFLKYWKNVLLTIALVFSIFFFVDPPSTAFFSGVIFIILATCGTLWIWLRDAVRDIPDEKSEATDENVKAPIFFNDDEISSIDDDQLGIAEDAKIFARQVLNNGSRRPIVFGLDSPWGTGKTSYINICQESVWKNEKNVLVFRFRPMIFGESKEDLGSIFVSEFIKTLKEDHVYLGGLDSDLEKLTRTLTGITIGGFGFNWKLQSESVAVLLKNVANHIGSLDKKIIVVVDDLDRLYLQDVKAILGVIRNIFSVSNMTFILCYDSSNINTFESLHKTTHTNNFCVSEDDNGSPSSKATGNNLGYSISREQQDSRMMNAYLEKFVQIKKSIIPSRERLKELMKKLIKKGGEENMGYTELTEAVDALFSPDSFWRFQPLIGDVRKVKRVVNLLLAGGKYSRALDANWSEMDIKPLPLLKLILVYINFPRIFEDIYISESNGSQGVFTSLQPRESERDKPPANSKMIRNYLNKLSGPESLLMHDLFCLDCLSGKCLRSSWPPEGSFKEWSSTDNTEVFRSSPIFNGYFGTNRNLDDYVAIIHDHHLKSNGEYHAFHRNRVQELEKKTVDAIFKEVHEYSLENGEKFRDRFFEAMQTQDISLGVANKGIEYIVKNIHKYSLVNEFSGVYEGIRRGLLHRLVGILELRGWPEIGTGEGRMANNDDNIKSIAERILIKDERLGKSILDGLLEPRHHPIIAIFDALCFVYLCTENQRLSFNVRRSLENYAKSESIDLKNTMYTKIFCFFYTHYINTKVNFLREIDEMDQNLLLGDFSKSITQKFESDNNGGIVAEVGKMKSSIISYILIWLSRDDSPTAVYKVTLDNGADAKEAMRDYLFDVCFNLQTDPDNACLFMNLVLISLENKGYSSEGYRVHFESLNVMLGADRLKNYWNSNHETIKKHLRSLSEDTMIYTYNYWFSYEEKLEEVFGNLDNLFPQ
jgi:hypothetical protein